MYFDLPEFTIINTPLQEIDFVSNSLLLSVFPKNDHSNLQTITANNSQLEKLLQEEHTLDKDITIYFPENLSTSCWMLSSADFDIKDINDWSKNLMKKVKNEKKSALYLNVNFQDPEQQMIISKLIKELYIFDKYKSNAENKLEKVYIINTTQSEITQVNLTEILNITEGINLCRDLGNEPANYLDPETYSKIIEQQFDKSSNITIKILDQQQMEDLHMGSLLGVAQGSVKTPKTVIMEYKGNPENSEWISFVGKGVTFDTGGISIKPSKGMEDMKFDMCGSATVVGLMKTLMLRNPKINVVGAVGLVENMPSGSAIRPGDILESMSGKTVEVLNTDAEGRLVLADVMWYVQENYKPSAMIDLATLTGACVVALGSEYAAIIGNDEELIKNLKNASDETAEWTWELPLAQREYGKLMKSKVADIRNISNGQGPGTITAALFLNEFVQEDTRWIHMDIAGTAWRKDSFPTGFGVYLLNQFLKENFEEK